MSRRFDVIDVG